MLRPSEVRGTAAIFVIVMLNAHLWNRLKRACISRMVSTFFYPVDNTMNTGAHNHEIIACVWTQFEQKSPEKVIRCKSIQFYGMRDVHE